MDVSYNKTFADMPNNIVEQVDKQLRKRAKHRMH